MSSDRSLHTHTDAVSDERPHPNIVAREQTVTVIVPVFDRAHTLARCLDSIAAQRHRPLHIVVVDNGSRDASCAVAEERLRHIARQGVEVSLLHESRPGANAARNRGLQIVKDGYVAFFDSDDEMSPDFLDRMLDAIRASGSARWAVARTRMVFADGRARARFGAPHPSPARHLLSAEISTQSFVAKIGLLHEVGGWDEDLTCWQDYELGLRLLLADPHPAWCEGVYHRLHQSADSITGTSLSANAAGIETALSRMADRIVGESPALSRTQRRKALRALRMRTHIVAGQMAHEGYRENGERLIATVESHLPAAEIGKCVGCRALRAYAAHGGRGAWRLAGLLLRFVS